MDLFLGVFPPPLGPVICAGFYNSASLFFVPWIYSAETPDIAAGHFLFRSPAGRGGLVDGLWRIGRSICSSP